MSDMDMAEAERKDLAALLAGLTPQQWQMPTLCDRWTVKDVVAHMISYDDLGPTGLAMRFVRGRLLWANQAGVDEFASYSPDQLLELLTTHLRPRGLTAGFGGMVGLVDGTIHHQDIRRGLGIPRQIPPQRLHRVLTAVRPNPRLGVPWRIRGLRLEATDLDWSTGKGLLVSGPGEALLMAMTGRRGIIAELTGPGRARLAGRIGD
ncbi:DinB family protein [Nocardia donostiensis]|uniref:DinB family protein n=1 Tax=Nocardia donostiensis TaxID=1538463 RepID=A0A1V2TEV3_9NOCA|nr:maleylpyruvate isomerase family mycothiol-dependent enzyme [Nocardia donostiensis]ONM48025.1 DinB family protein [Nocardia donostiensis]OQS21567.1 DinB family protein [Nocardia donostiensis]